MVWGGRRCIPGRPWSREKAKTVRELAWRACEWILVDDREVERWIFYSPRKYISIKISCGNI